MKTIFLVRHGKSMPQGTTGIDADRMLTDVGVERTRAVAKYISENHELPELIVSSAAERAYTTALILADQFGMKAESIETQRLIYSGDENDLIEILASTDNKYNSIMLVGHNPSISYAANKFIKPMIDSLPTSGVISVHLKTNDWAEINKTEFVLNFKIWPGML